MRRTDRLFELIQIFRGGRFQRGSDLADRLGVSLRTIYRDVETLVASGVPVEGARGVGYMLREPIQLPPMNLTHEELEALHLGAAMVRQVSDSQLAEAAERLLSKIDDVLPSDRPRSGHRWGSVIYALGAAGLVHAPRLRQAVRARRKVRLRYISLAGITTERVIRPLQLEYWGHAWTCTAWCELRSDFRVFRVDRVEDARMTSETFQQKQGQRLTDYLARIEAAEPSGQ